VLTQVCCIGTCGAADNKLALRGGHESKEDRGRLPLLKERREGVEIKKPKRKNLTG